MKAKYTKRQILESIKYWQRQLKTMNESVSLEDIKQVITDMSKDVHNIDVDEYDVVVDNYIDLIETIIKNPSSYESAKAMITLVQWLDDQCSKHQALSNFPFLIISMVIDLLRKK